MNKLILTFAFVSLFYIVSCTEDSDGNETDINLQPFIEMAKNAICADISNRLFVIDNEFVFWARRGRCPDNNYEYILYGKSIEEVICYKKDSIAGPQSSCDPTYEEMFQTILQNLDEPDLGLSEDHVVEEVSF